MHAHHILIVPAHDHDSAISAAGSSMDDFQDRVWDWYEFGGRWDGVQPFKEGVHAVSVKELGQEEWLKVLRGVLEGQADDILRSLAAINPDEDDEAYGRSPLLLAMEFLRTMTPGLRDHIRSSQAWAFTEKDAKERKKNRERLKKRLGGDTRAAKNIRKLLDQFRSGSTWHPDLYSMRCAIETLEGTYHFSSHFYDTIDHTAHPAVAIMRATDHWDGVAGSEWVVNLDLHS